MRFLHSKERGFTLVEVLFVAAIVVILVSVVLMNISEARKKARDTQRIGDLQQIQVALKMYRQVNSSGLPFAPLGEVVGDGAGNFDSSIVSYLAGIIKDPLSGTSGYEYYYDSSYDCTGTPQPVLIIKKMELAGNANHGPLCGIGEDLGNGVFPDDDSYILFLDEDTSGVAGGLGA